MTLKVTCPGCGASLRGPAELAGRTLRCARCQQPIAIPAAPAAGPAADAGNPFAFDPTEPAPAPAPPTPRGKRAAPPERAAEKRPGRGRAKSGGSSLLLVAGGVVGVAVLAVVVCGTVLALRWKKADAQTAQHSGRGPEASPPSKPEGKLMAAADAAKPASAKKADEDNGTDARPLRSIQPSPAAKNGQAAAMVGGSTVAFDPARPALKRPLGPVVQAHEVRVKLPVPAPDVLALLVSNAETNTALVYRRDEANADQPNRKEKLDRYDLSDGSLKDSLDIDPSYKLAGEKNARMDFGPDGKYFALADPGGSATVWSLDPPKRVAIDWKLLPPETPAAQRKAVGLAALYLLTEGRLVSVHTNGSVALWTVEDQKPVKTYAPAPPGNANPATADRVKPEQGRTVAVSPDRKSVVFAFGDRVYRYDPTAMTGAELLSLAGPEGVFHEPLGLTVTHDGQVVVLARDAPSASAKAARKAAPPDAVVLRYNLKGGPPAVVASCGMNPPARVAGRNGSTLLLADETGQETAVIDTETGKALAYWHLWNGVGLQSLEELKGRHWYVTAEKPTDLAWLVGVPAGGEGLRDMQEQAKVLGPQGGISYALTVSGLQEQ